MADTIRKGAGEFPVYQLSGKASEIIADLQQADFEFARADDTGETSSAYSKMNTAKHSLVEYLELLESRLNITPAITYRF